MQIVRSKNRETCWRDLLIYLALRGNEGHYRRQMWATRDKHSPYIGSEIRNQTLQPGLPKTAPTPLRITKRRLLCTRKRLYARAGGG